MLLSSKHNTKLVHMFLGRKAENQTEVWEQHKGKLTLHLSSRRQAVCGVCSDCRTQTVRLLPLQPSALLSLF